MKQIPIAFIDQEACNRTCFAAHDRAFTSSWKQLVIKGATRCEHCDGTGHVHRADGEYLGECDCGFGGRGIL